MTISRPAEWILSSAWDDDVATLDHCLHCTIDASIIILHSDQYGQIPLSEQIRRTTDKLCEYAHGGSRLVFIKLIVVKPDQTALSLSKQHEFYLTTVHSNPISPSYPSERELPKNYTNTMSSPKETEEAPPFPHLLCLLRPFIHRIFPIG